MKLCLIVAKGKHQGMPVPIKVDLFLMGSDRVCQLRSDLPGIAAQHCALITRDGRKAFVRDLDSGESTLVNGDLVPPGQEWPLHAGDRLTVGPLEFMIQFHEKQLSKRDMEEWALRCLDKADEKKEGPGDDDLVNLDDRITQASQAASSILEKLSAKRGVVKGRLRIGKEAAVTTVKFNDIYLVEEPEIALVKKELYDNLSQPNMRVLLDFKNVRRMSSSAAEMILELYHWLRNWGSIVALCRVRPELLGIMHTLHVTEAVPHYPEKLKALASHW